MPVNGWPISSPVHPVAETPSEQYVLAHDPLSLGSVLGSIQVSPGVQVPASEQVLWVAGEPTAYTSPSLLRSSCFSCLCLPCERCGWTAKTVPRISVSAWLPRIRA